MIFTWCGHLRLERSTRHVLRIEMKYWSWRWRLRSGSLICVSFCFFFFFLLSLKNIVEFVLAKLEVYFDVSIDLFTRVRAIGRRGNRTAFMARKGDQIDLWLVFSTEYDDKEGFFLSAKPKYDRNESSPKITLLHRGILKVLLTLKLWNDEAVYYSTVTHGRSYKKMTKMIK